jgi:hypothetical protein
MYIYNLELARDTRTHVVKNVIVPLALMLRHNTRLFEEVVPHATTADCVVCRK